jgi:hypothetical protein
MRATAVIVAGSSAVATPAPATTQATIFYLDLKVGTCAKQVTTKRFLVLPCSNGTQQYEVFAVVHGGWTQAPAYRVAYARAQGLCLSTFARRYGGALGTPYGWYAFWPDAGAESARYHDRIVCTLVRPPGHPSLGAGTHFAKAARR